ncbi:uncharacterized protein DFL_008327 [Arthrobotrys flagrans]|uniref:TATA box binding protein associated factor (TAF) histone-like fold domain-containing protein n=1 Tax=Arthrobotrys flagrans TaxID=97331 RepID=A0A436ZNH0_ARTFL|nr:hypothetical protein DFL_008327 [Arthrobotrys flagrans]
MASLVSIDTVRDNSESMGVRLDDDVAQALASDVEYRLRQIMAASIEVMKESGRTTLYTKDLEMAAKLLDIDPPLGYQSNLGLRWGEATLGAGQPLFYIEDEEVDFEKIINASLPKVPREVTMTAHWTAIEGVQPQVPMNPSPAEARMNELVPRGATTAHALGAAGNSDNATVKPAAKHILSVELQMFFDKVISSVIDYEKDDLRSAALSALRTEPAIHQLLPYFVSYVTERVTHDQKVDIKLMESMMDICDAMIDNESLFMDLYVEKLCPPILTCAVGKYLGPNTQDQTPTFPLRRKAVSILRKLAINYGESSHTLRSRLGRSFLKRFLDNKQSYGSHYGSILGLANMGGTDSIRVLLLPNVKLFEEFIRDEIQGDGPRKAEALECLKVLVETLATLKNNKKIEVEENGENEEELRTALVDGLGPLAASEILKLGDLKLVKILLKSLIPI